jgi:hypothetical protein
MSLGYTCELNAGGVWTLARSESLPSGAQYRGVAEITEADAEIMDRAARTAAIMPATKVNPTGRETEWLATVGDAAAWSANIPAMPNEGVLAVGTVWGWGGKAWEVIGQGFDRAIYGGDPAVYVSLCVEQRDPFRIGPWTTTGQFTAYMLANDITGLPECCTHVGKTWQTRRNLNTWEPGSASSGWLQISGIPAPWYHVGNEGYPVDWQVTHNGATWENPTEGEFREPGTPGASWIDQTPAPEYVAWEAWNGANPYGPSYFNRIFTEAGQANRWFKLTDPTGDDQRGWPPSFQVTQFWGNYTETDASGVTL